MLENLGRWKLQEKELTVDLLDNVLLGERWEERESLKEPAKRRRRVVVREGCRI
jgi:hypothetical protein